MTNRTIAKVALLAALAGVLLIGTATAQQGNQTDAGGNESIPDGESIDGQTVIVNSEYLAGSQEGTITLYSRTLQQVTITDVSPYMDGGEMEQRSITLRPGQETTIEIAVDPASNGFVGLSIATQSTLYAVPLKRPGIGLGAPQPNDLMALLIGAVAPIGAGRAIEWYHSRKRKRGVVRIDG